MGDSLHHECSPPRFVIPSMSDISVLHFQVWSRQWITAVDLLVIFIVTLFSLSQLVAISLLSEINSVSIVVHFRINFVIFTVSLAHKN